MVFSSHSHSNFTFTLYVNTIIYWHELDDNPIKAGALDRVCCLMCYKRFKSKVDKCYSSPVVWPSPLACVPRRCKSLSERSIVVLKSRNLKCSASGSLKVVCSSILLWTLAMNHGRLVVPASERHTQGSVTRPSETTFTKWHGEIVVSITTMIVVTVTEVKSSCTCN